MYWVRYLVSHVRKGKLFLVKLQVLFVIRYPDYEQCLTVTFRLNMSWSDRPWKSVWYVWCSLTSCINVSWLGSWVFHFWPCELLWFLKHTFTSFYYLYFIYLCLIQTPHFTHIVLNNFIISVHVLYSKQHFTFLK